MPSAVVRRPSNLNSPYMYSRVLIPSAQFLTLFTTSIDVVPAVPGIVHLPLVAHVFRAAGTAYVINTALQFRHSTTAITPSISNTPFTGTTDASQSLGFQDLTLSSASLGNSINFFATGGNPTTGTGDITVVIYYQDFPLNPTW